LGGDRVVALLLPGHRDTVRSETPYRACSPGEPVKNHAWGMLGAEPWKTHMGKQY